MNLERRLARAAFAGILLLTPASARAQEVQNETYRFEANCLDNGGVKAFFEVSSNRVGEMIILFEDRRGSSRFENRLTSPMSYEMDYERTDGLVLTEDGKFVEHELSARVTFESEDGEQTSFESDLNLNCPR